MLTDSVRRVTVQASILAALREYGRQETPDVPDFSGDSGDLSGSDLVLILSGAILPLGSSMILPSGRRISGEQWCAMGGCNS